MARKEYEEKYTHPELREKLLEEIKQSDRGGEPGQWSARKAQLLTQEYEKQGGSYKGAKDESQKSLERWTEEEWQTREGETKARKDGETARYLPKEAWEELSPEEREATERKKREASREGEQYVENTAAAKEARKEASLPITGYDDLNVGEIKDKLGRLSNEEIKSLRSYEREHKNRKTLLEHLDRKTGDGSLPA